MRERNVSIITVVWNALLEIQQTINSILPHLNDAVELIIVDGGSTDGTVELLETYRNNSNIFVISEKDNGIYDAMNKGAKLAKGKWFIYINAGDLLIKLPQDFNDGGEVVCFAVKTEEGITYPEFGWRMRVHNTLPHQGIFYKKTSFIGFDDTLKVFADYDYNLKLLERNTQVVLSREVVSFHSLKGVSNSPAAGKELKYVLKKNVSLFWRCISFLYFKHMGLKKRISVKL